MAGDGYAAQLSQKLGLGESADHNALQKFFQERVHKLMAPGTLACAEAKEEINDLFRVYGYYNSEYIRAVCARSAKKAKDYPDAGAVKSNAGSIVQGLYKVMGEFCACLLELETIRARVGKDMQAAKGRAAPEHKDVQWSHDLPEQIAISVRRRDALTKTLSQMECAERIVFLLDTVLNFMAATLCDLLGEEKTKSFMNDYTAGLRGKKQGAARTFLLERAQAETGKFFMLKKKEKKRKWALLIEIAGLIEQLIKKCRQGICSAEGRIFLKASELNVAREETENQLQKSKDFIAKYELPEIIYRYDALGRQRKKLDELGPFEDKLQMIEQMEMSCHSPMPTMKDVKTFEAGLYAEALKFLEQDSIEIENILHLARELGLKPDPAAVSDEEIASAKIGD